MWNIGNEREGNIHQESHWKVLILIYVEYGEWVRVVFKFIFEKYVLILIYVEYGEWVLFLSLFWKIYFVLILIYVEYGEWGKRICRFN